ncbi:MAG TPA: ABC transporter permease [Polyangiales bacterium]
MSAPATTELCSAPLDELHMPQRMMGMTTLIAWRNLVHDQVRFVVTLTGIVFSVVLMGMQSGLLIGFSNAASGLIDHSRAQLWMVAKGTQTVDINTPLDESRRFQALAIPGVRRAEPYLIGFTGWMRPDGGTESVSIVGLEDDAELAGPWNLVEGTRADLRRPGGVIVDRLYASKLGVKKLGETIEINGHWARVVGFTEGVRTFTQSPYVFTSLRQAQTFLRMTPHEAGYVLLTLDDKADPAWVEAQLEARIPNVDVFSQAAFSKSSSDYWLYTTGAGISLIISALLGLVVGIAVVTQTLYASTMDRLPGYGTLKAMGAPNSYLYRIIVTQAVMSAAIGYAIGIAIVGILVLLTQSSTAAPQVTFPLALLLAVLTLAMCIGAAVLSIRKVMTLDPVAVFR